MENKKSMSELKSVKFLKPNIFFVDIILINAVLPTRKVGNVGRKTRAGNFHQFYQFLMEIKSASWNSGPMQSLSG